MAWEQLVTEDVLAEFTLAEASALRQVQGSGSGSGLPFLNLDVITARVIDEVRGYIEAGDYTLDAISNTIPVSLFNEAIAIARWRYLIAAPSFRQLQTEERRQSFEDALKKLALIAAQKFRVESPTEETTPRGGNWNSENPLRMRTHPVPPPSSQFPPIANEWANAGQVQQPVFIGGALYVPTIVALRNDPNSLEAYPSAAIVTGSLLLIVVDLSNSTWQLLAGPADVGNPDGEVQPLDYDVGTNNRHWAKVGGL